MADSESSSLKGGRSRRAWTLSAESESMEASSRSNGRSSNDSERPRTQAGEAPETAKASPSGFSKLLKSRGRRRKKDQSQEDIPPVPDLVIDQDLEQFPSHESGAGSAIPSSNNSSAPPEAETTNLLTDDSEPEKTPPLISRDSHTGFYTSSSPLIKTTSVDSHGREKDNAEDGSAVSASSVTASSESNGEPPKLQSQPSLNLDVPVETSGKRRGVSPGRRRLKDAFSSSEKKGAGDDADAASSKSGGSRRASIFSSRRSSLSAKRAQAAPEAPPPLPAPIQTDIPKDEPKPRTLEESPIPNTPPSTAIPVTAPATTVTPPTPTEHKPFQAGIVGGNITDSPESIKPRSSMSSTGITTVSPSGNMISHRRVRSASAAHGPSKLSSSISSLGPVHELAKPPKSASSQQTGFFSSMFSAAQNAASSITSSLNVQQRNRTDAQPSPSDLDPPTLEGDSEDSVHPSNTSGEASKPSTVETMGSGDLNFSHLDLDVPSGEVLSSNDRAVVTDPETPDRRRNNAVRRRDEEAAKLEDVHAVRAVNMAYEKASEKGALGSPGDEVFENQSFASLPRDGVLTGDHTPPTGSVIDSDVGSGTRRTGSVRSRLSRRHRGISGATTSTIGAIGANALAVGGPTGINSSVPRLTGFAVASKKRNRDFHSLFRSVPEDDYLIEDYSSALQREIILAGRLYISEGHICFSSNILGWVTTLVISFDEVVAIEKENTAMVFPNAIGIQTLHARHTFRSLLSRESTYDLMVNIWKINHPSLKSSVNGTRVTSGTGDKTEKVGDGEEESATDVSDEDEIYDEDEEGDNADSFFDAGASANASDRSLPGRAGLTRQPSGLSGTGTVAAGQASGNDAKNGNKKGAGEEDFPGPSTHAPSEYTDPDGQYEKVIKDEVIPAPLGKVYSFVFGPASGEFMTKFLVDNQKSGELQFEGTTKGLTTESPTRKYSYIKPLPGSIGPRQTKCISTENLDFLDLEKAVLVTLTTQTPDVPSGNVFCVKTKYLFTWATNNQTRFLMTCSIEWSGKSWLKGPIEKGAIDGQGTFGTDLVKALKAGVTPRERATGGGGGRSKGRRKKGDAEIREPSNDAANKGAAEASTANAESWGLFEPVRPILEPVTSMVKPFWSNNIAVLIVGLLLYLTFFRSPSTPTMLPSDVGCSSLSLPQRLAAYEEMWRLEENELWNWLEERTGMDGMVFPSLHQRTAQQHRQSSRVNAADQRDFVARLREEKVSDREMSHAIRTTRQRLDILEEMMNGRRVDDAPDEPARSEL
ncbi:hypothetical protein N7468_008060 [Penicillium chermesinum]|uniref:VASt domain-containing protein n=1 Tax=Penicillium chermesinum TaxID=63820 RepID=A0A9W9TI36_9EURO|nr:uncharacterized protein N7468_008060 [Penicillium chermesinum]KAJ5223518.1 hypothetical protein N7468_008060 [Penicillium chermesinum]